jgi:sulfotransferase family protein
MAEPGPDRPKVLYVIGAHRSGSTVLGVTLGNCDGVFFAGELHSWLTRKGVPSFGGEQGARLWRAIADEVPDAQELFGHETQLVLDRSSVIYRPHKWPRRRRLRGPYRRIYQDLYRAIARQTGSSLIVDTSHYPLRAIELQALDGIELYLLFLVRDPQGVVDSFDARHTDSPSKSAFVTNAQLWVTYLLALPAFVRQPRERRMFVRHEDFLADPGGVVRQILDRTGSDASIPDLTALRTGSPLQGNRFLKRSEVIALRRPGAPPPRSPMTKVIQLPLALIFSRLRPAVVAGPAARDAAAAADAHLGADSLPSHGPS